MEDLNGMLRGSKHRSLSQQNVPLQVEPRLPGPGPYQAELILDDTASYMATNPDMVFSDVYGQETAYYGIGFGSDKQGSNTDAGSFVNINSTPSVVTRSTNSYVNILVQHRRADSNGSSGASAEGDDGHLYSVPASCDGDWQTAAEFAVDMDTTEDEPIRAMARQDPKHILSDMYSAEPKLVPNPYSTDAAPSTNGESPGSMDYMENYTMSSANQLQTLKLPSRPSDEQPWTHMEYRVPRYEPGFTAFAPSPGPAAEDDQEEIRPSLSVPKSRSREQSSRPKKSSFKGIERARGRAWENTVIQKGGVQLIMNSEEHINQRGGVRKGKLDPDAAEKARKIRRITACWNCWIQKVPCSEGVSCDRCRRQFSPSSNQVCCRSHFKEYESALFPEYLHSHFKKRKIEELINEHTSGFRDATLEIDVATGECFMDKPMRLQANVFRPKDWELLRQHRLATEHEEQDSRLMLQISAPVGLLGLATAEMKEKCREHIEDMIESPNYVDQVMAGCHSEIPYDILTAAVRFSSSKDVPLVRNALMLHAINYFMKTLMTFSEESASKVYQTLQEFGEPRKPYLSSRLLNRQVKYAMHRLSREVTVEVLEGLERSMRSRTKDSWGASFCAFLVLCLCMENLQIACDIYVVCDIEKCQKDGSRSAYDRSQSYQASQKVDENPFFQCKRLFHDIYRTHKESSRGAREAGFNPLRNLALHDMNTGLDPAADAMVKSIYQMICQHYLEVVDLSERPPLINPDYPLTPENIKVNGIGRLATKFLRSFFPDHWWPS